MNFNYFNLQLFAEGGAGAEGTAATDTTGGNFGETEKKRGKGNPLQDVVYGKQTEETAESIADSENDVNSKTSKIPFEDLIKGEYKQDFEERTQKLINKRFKETKALQETLSSHQSIMNMLADKYGLDSTDIAGLQKAIEGDDAYMESEAIEKGLTVKQLKELKSLERQNREYAAKEEAQKRKEASDRIYSQWLQEAEALQQKYGLENFSLETEVQNPDFVNLLSHNISLESAYKAIHMDEMMTGAMAKTANVVKEKMANSIQSRQSRPTENGINTTTSKTFKNDVNSLTKRDRDEIERRVMRGANISF